MIPLLLAVRAGKLLTRAGKLLLGCCCEPATPFVDCLSCCPWPPYVRLTLGNVVPLDPADCEFCAAWNGEFVLEKYGESCVAATAASVAYRLRPLGTGCYPCPLIDLTISCNTITPEVGDPYPAFTLSLYVYEHQAGDDCTDISGYSGFANWQGNMFRPATCNFRFTQADWDIGGAGSFSTGGLAGCDFSGATADFVFATAP